MNREFKTILALILLISLAALLGCQSTAIRSARVYLQQDNPEKAIEVLEEGTRAEPANPEIWYELGYIHGTKRQYTEMNEAFDKALSLDAATYENQVREQRDFYWVKHNNNGITFGNNGEFEKALEEFKIAAAIDDQKAKSQFGLGWMYAKMTEHEKAIPYLIKVTELDPGDHLAWQQLVSGYDQTENDEKLIETCQKLLEHHPDNLIGMQYLARAYEKSENNEQAIELYEKILVIEPENGDTWFELGALYARGEKNEDAARCFKKTLEYIPDDYDALFNLALVLTRAKHFEEALGFTDKMIKLKPDNPEPYRIKGGVYRDWAAEFEAQENEDKTNECKAKSIEAFKKANELIKDES